MRIPKSLFLLFLLFPVVALLRAQEFTSPSFSLTVTPEVRTPNLSFLTGGISFNDEDGNNTINADERVTITARVVNNGNGDARGCTAMLSARGAISGLTFSRSQAVGTIPAGETRTVSFQIASDLTTVDGPVTFTLQVDEPEGFGTESLDVSATTAAFLEPHVCIVDHVKSSPALRRKSQFDMSFILQNTRHGRAEDVDLRLSLPDQVFVTDGDIHHHYAFLRGGQSDTLHYTITASQKYQASSLPVRISLREKYGEYSEDFSLNIPVAGDNGGTSVSFSPTGTVQPQQEEIRIASFNSDVDRDIPVSDQVSSDTYVLIIANEHYHGVAPVPYAIHDGTSFSAYCHRTLGIPQENINLYTDATYGQMKGAINYIRQISSTVGSRSRLIVYYAGHGIPDESSRSSYLLPVDGSPTDLSLAHSLDQLYADLAATQFSSVTLFLDACFSGSLREEGMLLAARGVAIKARQARPQGNMVVFSAAQGSETAYPYSEKGHGMFTYFLLKKLQESRGSATYSELSDYIISNVRLKSLTINRKAQTPSVATSDALSESWRDLSLR